VEDKREVSSEVALGEKVTLMMEVGEARSRNTRRALRAIMRCVLPEPGGATTRVMANVECPAFS